VHVLLFGMLRTRVCGPTYLCQWHTGNGIGRSSLCCSSPGWHQPPGSGSISEKKEAGMSVFQICPSPTGLPLTSSIRLQHMPLWLAESVVAGWGGWLISNCHSLTTPWEVIQQHVLWLAPTMLSNQMEQYTGAR
jgi:hypothetical protein